MSQAAASLSDPALGAQLQAWQTLPPEWYTSREIHDAEQRQIFQRAWQYAGHASLVQQPGDYFTAQAGEVPVVVTRDRDGELHAFLNVCRHRAFVVAEGHGNRRALRCGYHGWSYGLDGALIGAPHSDSDPDFDRCRLGLIPIQVEILGPFVFVNPDRDAGPLRELTGNLLERLAARGWEAEAFGPRVTRVIDIDCNWKLMIENDECYHCAVLHPVIASTLDTRPDSMSVTCHHERFWDFCAPRKGEAAGALGDDDVYFANYFLWPNFWLVTRRDGYTYTGVTLPLGPDRARLVTEYWFPHGESQDSIEESIELAESILQEDFDVLVRIQRNHRSGMAGLGRLNKEMEGLVRSFEREVHRAVTAG